MIEPKFGWSAKAARFRRAIVNGDLISVYYRTWTTDGPEEREIITNLSEIGYYHLIGNPEVGFLPAPFLEGGHPLSRWLRKHLSNTEVAKIYKEFFDEEVFREEDLLIKRLGLSEKLINA